MIDKKKYFKQLLDLAGKHNTIARNLLKDGEYEGSEYNTGMAQGLIDAMVIYNDLEN